MIGAPARVPLWHLLCRIVVDLANSVFYQKCHDPECRRVDFKSRGWCVCVHVYELCMFNDMAVLNSCRIPYTSAH